MDPTTLDATSRLVLSTVLRHGPIARVAIAHATGLSTGSLTRLATPLVAAGYLREGEAEKAALGRPTLPLEIVDAAARFLGVKVVAGGLHAVLTGLGGAVHATMVEGADTSTPATTAIAIAGLVRRLAGDEAPAVVGVALAAAVDASGEIRDAGLLGWEGGNLARDVATATGIPCVAANDVDALALAEHWFGHGRGVHDFTVLTVGAGVGSAAVVGDALLVGRQGAAAMLGNAWAHDGRGFEEVLTTAAFSRAAARSGRAAAAEEAADVLGELAALAALAFDPERILITGEGIGEFADLLPLVVESLRAHLPGQAEPPEVVVDELDFLDWARGAAALAIHHCLTA